MFFTSPAVLYLQIYFGNTLQQHTPPGISVFIFLKHIPHDFHGKFSVGKHHFRSLPEMGQHQFHIVNAIVADFPERGHDILPVNIAGTGHFVLIGHAVIVMQMQDLDALAQPPDHFCRSGLAGEAERLVGMAGGGARFISIAEL